MKIFFNLVALAATLSQVVSTRPDEYACGVCLAIADEIIATKAFGTPMKTICQRILPGADAYCNLLDDKEVLKFEFEADSSRKMCQYKNYCPEETVVPLAPGAGNSNLEIRVAKGLGTRPYNEVRLSVISNKTLTNSVFTYSKPFTYKWQNSSTTGVNILNTGIATVTPGKTTSFIIDGQKVDILIPLENAGTRGIIIADPCFQSNWVGCA